MPTAFHKGPGYGGEIWRVNRRVRLAKRSAFVAAIALGVYFYTTSQTLTGRDVFVPDGALQPNEHVAESSREARKRAFAGRL